MRFALLDPLRGLAAVWVMMFHYHFSVDFREGLPSIYSLTRVGHLGVAMFFVISGYCLTASARSAARREEAVGSFLYRRVKRIYPPFWCSIIVVAAIPFAIEGLSSLKTGAYAAPSAENPNYGYLKYNAWDWLRLVTLTQAFHPHGPNISAKFTSINAVYWSLAIEVQFYLVIAIALIFAKRFYVILGLVLAASIPFALSAAAYRHGIFLPFWPMFACGILLYFFLERGWRVERLLGNPATLVSGVVIVSMATSFCWLVVGGWRINHQMFSFAFAFCLWFATPFDVQFTELPKNRWRIVRTLASSLLMLGAMSYSLYLIHGRLQFLVIQMVRQVFSESILRDILVIAATIAACYPFYRLCECPFFRPADSTRSATRSSQPVQNETALYTGSEGISG